MSVKADERSTSLIESATRYSLADASGSETTQGRGRVTLDAESLTVLPELGEPLYVTYRDVEDVKAAEHRIELPLASGETLTLSHLGYTYEDVLRSLRALRGEVLLRDLLMHETLHMGELRGDVAATDDDGATRDLGRCELRLYETGLVVIPHSDAPLRVPFAEIDGARVVGHAVMLDAEELGTLTFSKMGRLLDPFVKALSDTMNDLSVRTQQSLKDLLPASDPATIRRTARFLRDGKAAQRSDIESVSPELWTELERTLDKAGMAAEYEVLASLGVRERICIGIKRGLMGDLTGDYIWFLVPIHRTGSDAPGSAIAMEAGMLGGSSRRATYFFRLAAGSSPVDPTALELEIDATIRRVNRCMLAINFRREPLYLPEERLREPRYEKYRHAIAAIPELRELRRLFLGRVFHRDSEQWQADVVDLLRFSVTTGAGERWRHDQAQLDEPDELFADSDEASAEEPPTQMPT